MKKMYAKNELAFAIFWIVIYSVLQSLANPLNKIIGIECSANLIFSILLTLTLLSWIKKNNLFKQYGLCKTSVPASRFLYYIPLLILASHNLWNGIAINFPFPDTACYICYMLCVGFLEEVIFRGFLFKAIARDNIKTAIIISSITFGLGHLLNLLNGSGMELIANLCQVIGAIAAGFLFVTIFYRGGSLLPCIITHSVLNAVSVFANEAGLTGGRRVIFSASRLVIVIIYTLILTKTLPQTQYAALENY